MTTAGLPKAPKSLTTYLEQHGDLPADILLGRIVLFTVTDEPVKRDDVIKWFKKLELNPEFVPPENKAHHAFEKATSETKDVYPMTKAREGHLMCRDVSRNGMTIRRQITREIKDGRNKVLAYHRAIDLQFVKPSDPTDQGGARLRITIDTENLEYGERDDLKSAADQIQARYFRYLEFFDGMKLRAMVRDYLKKQLNAIEVKGGVYFVLHQYDDELARLSELVSKLGGDCNMSMIPIVNVERERKFLTQILQREATEALNNLAKEIEEASTSTDVRPATVARLQQKFADMQASTAEHMDTLQVTKSVTTAASQRVTRLLGSLQVKAMRS